MGYMRLDRTGKVRAYRADSLKAKTLEFVREYCEDLGFDEKIDNEEKATGVYQGKSLTCAVPYNMEMDTNRLCFERAIERFLKSGRKEDAFDVYFCYLDIFIKDYKTVRHMIELLSEYEANGSGLLIKHRDHYSHSVYVFCLGLAIYVSSSEYRQQYSDLYKLGSENEAAHHFLKYWGLSSLFHDIGYPFELPFEQVCSYFEVSYKGEKEQDKKKKKSKRENNPFVSYRDLDKLNVLTDKEKAKIEKVCKRSFSNTNELFAYLIKEKLGGVYGIDEQQLLGYLDNKPLNPNMFGHFMDHAYFSATVLFRKLFGEMDLELDKSYLDALTAILLHNSLYKFCVANPNMSEKKPGMHMTYKDEGNIPFKASVHPLAFMLMLCDELQCWDRTAYGRNSKLEFHPMHCRFYFSEDNLIRAEYKFDKAGQVKIDQFIDSYKKWDASAERNKDDEPKLKAFSSMYVKKKISRVNGEEAEVTDFQSDIEKILDLSKIKLNVTYSVEDRKKKNGFLSESNFINIYDFAAALNARWAGKNVSSAEQLEMFENLSLEYKLSNINQAKSFAKYLTEINAFFTNKEVDFEKVDSFTEDELKKIGPMEHLRWLDEHYDMGWDYISKEELRETVKNKTGLSDIESDEFKAAFKQERELTRLHWDMIEGYDLKQDKVTDEQSLKNYDRIGQIEQDKDTKPMITMLRLLEEYEGLRIYRYN